VVYDPKPEFKGGQKLAEWRLKMKAKAWVDAAILLCMPSPGRAQETSYNGLDNHLSELYRLSSAKTRSLSPENPTGEKGKGGMATEETGARATRDLGQGWKISPSVGIGPGQTYTVAEITGSGAIQHIWMTPTGNWRLSILRMYWDEETQPSVEVPVGDFFAMGWGKYARISSLAVCVNLGSAFNSYWPMPFRRKAKITIENLDDKVMTLFYQVDYTLSSVPKDAAYFHAQFRRVNPLPYKQDYTIVDGIQGKGHYVGTYLAWGVHNNGWWGEGEIKFCMDGHREFPTINGTVCTPAASYFCRNPESSASRQCASTLETDMTCRPGLGESRNLTASFHNRRIR
jgi:hypothetical protein